jgi:hypothetical protein
MIVKNKFYNILPGNPNLINYAISWIKYLPEVEMIMRRQ